MQRFVVGTGRCGSTLLDRMLAEHPDALVLPEFFSSVDRGQVFAEGEITGPKFAAVLMRANPHVEIMAARRDVTIFPAVLGPWAHNGGTPGPLLVTFPSLTDDAAALLASVVEEARGWPTQTLGGHLQALFDSLTRRFGKQFWLERSGISLDYLDRILDLFPEAKLVHIHRNGPESALSMRDHPSFALFVSYLVDPPSDEEIAVTLAGPSSAKHDLLLHRLANRPPVECFGEYWTEQVAKGMRELRKLDPARYLEVRYEDLVSSTGDVLSQIAKFFGFPDAPGWIDRASALVSDSPARMSLLTDEEQSALLAACRPGQILLEQIHPTGLEPLWARMRNEICVEFV